MLPRVLPFAPHVEPAEKARGGRAKVSAATPPSEAATCGAGVEEKLDKPNADKVRDAREESEVVEEKLTVRKEDFVSFELVEETLIVVIPPMLRVSEDLVDLGEREVQNWVTRLGVVLHPREGEFLLLLDRHQEV